MLSDIKVQQEYKGIQLTNQSNLGEAESMYTVTIKFYNPERPVAVAYLVVRWTHSLWIKVCFFRCHHLRQLPLSPNLFATSYRTL